MLPSLQMLSQIALVQTLVEYSTIALQHDETDFTWISVHFRKNETICYAGFADQAFKLRSIFSKV